MVQTREQFEEYRTEAFAVYKRQVAKFHAKFTSRGILPRNHVWRPYRFATRNVIIGMAVIRHASRGNRLEVDVCLMHTPEVFEEYEGTRVMLSFLLSEAFKSGGSMGIQFSPNVEGGRVPAQICDYAIWHGVKLKTHNVFKGIITPKEARKLYLSVTKLSPEAITRVMELAVRDKLSPERACYMIHHGIWSVSQAEVILLGAKWPDDLLLGTYPPELRHFHFQGLNDATMAVLGGFIDRKMKTRTPDSSEETVEDKEGDEVRLTIRFNPELFANEYVAEESVKIPWVIGPKLPTLIKGSKLSVLLRPRHKAEIAHSALSDIKAAKLALLESKSAAALILYPHDFTSLTQAMLKKLVGQLDGTKIYFGACPETLAALSKEAASKLTLSEILRAEV